MRDDFLRKEGLSNDIAREIKLSTKMLDVEDGLYHFMNISFSFISPMSFFDTQKYSPNGQFNLPIFNDNA